MAKSRGGRTVRVATGSVHHSLVTLFMTTKPTIRLFSSDLDGTLLGNPESTLRFKQVWEQLKPGERPLLVYNSGRSVKDTRGLVTSRRLPEPDYIVGGVGTELHHYPANREEDQRSDDESFAHDGVIDSGQPSDAGATRPNAIERPMQRDGRRRLIGTSVVHLAAASTIDRYASTS